MYLYKKTQDWLFKRRFFKYLVIFLASLFSALIIRGLIELLVYIYNDFNFKNFSFISFIYYIFLIFFMFIFSKKKFLYPFSVFFITILSAGLLIGIEHFDSYFTNDHNITIEWQDFFGWTMKKTKMEAMKHRIIGLFAVIFPTIFLLCSFVVIFIYSSFKKNNYGYPVSVH